MSMLFSFTACTSINNQNSMNATSSGNTVKTTDEILENNIETSADDENDEIKYVTFPILFEETANYKIYATEDKMAFEYYVYSNDDSLIDRGFGGYSNSDGVIDFNEEEDWLVLSLSFMMNSVHHKYYDLERGLVSRFFPEPSKISDDMIAYFIYKNGDSPFLIVQDIFEPSLYYKEFEWNYPSYLFRDSSSVTFEFLNNNTELQITYLNENSNEYDTVVYDLRG